MNKTIEKLKEELQNINMEIREIQSKHDKELDKLINKRASVLTEIEETENENKEISSELIAFYYTIGEEYDSDDRKILKSLLIKVDNTIAHARIDGGALNKNMLFRELSNINHKMTSDLFNELITFLWFEDIIEPYRGFVCETCNSIVTSFKYEPTQDELSDFLYEQYICSTCKNEIDHNTPVSELVDIGVYVVNNSTEGGN